MIRLLTVLPALVVAAMLCGAFPASAQTPRQVTWEDLMPPDTPLPDPFAHLSMDIVVKLHGIIGIREQKRMGQLSEVSPEYEQSLEFEHDLKRMGVDVERLIREYWEMDREIERRNRLVVPELDGQFVRIPGYALPLEAVGLAIEEFLLVPYVGACIHVPPPPPNQMVLVKLKEPFVATDLFAPVWITGRVTVKTTTKSVFITDGTAPVESGYIVENAQVEPYRE
ncbi:MAG: DUF3299 domain-containing protein [Rhodospirillaceae bacterium]